MGLNRHCLPDRRSFRMRAGLGSVRSPSSSYLGRNSLGFAPLKPFGSNVAFYFVGELYKPFGSHFFRIFCLELTAFHASEYGKYLYKPFHLFVSGVKGVFGKLSLA